MTVNDPNNDPFFIDKAVVPTLVQARLELEEVTSTLNTIMDTVTNDIKAIEDHEAILPNKLLTLLTNLDRVTKYLILVTENIQSHLDEIKDNIGVTEFEKIKIRFVVSMKEKE